MTYKKYLVSLLAMQSGLMLFLWLISSNTDPASPTEMYIKPTTPVIQSIITKHCRSISGVSLEFSVVSFSTPENKFGETKTSVYSAVDPDGVRIEINSSNYGQWKCET